MSDVVLVDATTPIALGNVGRVDLLKNFDGDLVVPELVAEEVTTDPAKTNVSSFLDESKRWDSSNVPEANVPRAVELLGDEQNTGDVQIIVGVLHFQNANPDLDVAVVSDDRRVGTVARGLGVTVTGTVGVLVRAVHEGMDPEKSKSLLRDIDSHGLHMTGELREKAYELLEDAADD
jgi:predicted nucleic acid-binding protein